MISTVFFLSSAMQACVCGDPGPRKPYRNSRVRSASSLRANRAGCLEQRGGDGVVLWDRSVPRNNPQPQTHSNMTSGHPGQAAPALRDGERLGGVGPGGCRRQAAASTQERRPIDEQASFTDDCDPYSMVAVAGGGPDCSKGAAAWRRNAGRLASTSPPVCRHRFRQE